MRSSREGHTREEYFDELRAKCQERVRQDRKELMEKLREINENPNNEGKHAGYKALMSTFRDVINTSSTSNIGSSARSMFASSTQPQSRSSLYQRPITSLAPHSTTSSSSSATTSAMTSADPSDNWIDSDEMREFEGLSHDEYVDIMLAMRDTLFETDAAHATSGSSVMSADGGGPGAGGSATGGGGGDMSLHYPVPPINIIPDREERLKLQKLRKEEFLRRREALDRDLMLYILAEEAEEARMVTASSSSSSSSSASNPSTFNPAPVTTSSLSSSSTSDAHGAPSDRMNGSASAGNLGWLDSEGGVSSASDTMTGQGASAGGGSGAENAYADYQYDDYDGVDTGGGSDGGGLECPVCGKPELRATGYWDVVTDSATEASQDIVAVECECGVRVPARVQCVPGEYGDVPEPSSLAHSVERAQGGLASILEAHRQRDISRGGGQSYTNHNRISPTSALSSSSSSASSSRCIADPVFQLGSAEDGLEGLLWATCAQCGFTSPTISFL